MQSRKFDGSLRADGMKAQPGFGNICEVSTGASRAIHKLTRVCLISILAASLGLAAAAQTNNSHEATAASFQGLGQMPGVWPAAGTYASAVSALKLQ